MKLLNFLKNKPIIIGAVILIILLTNIEIYYMDDCGQGLKFNFTLKSREMIDREGFRITADCQAPVVYFSLRFYKKN